MFLVTWQDDFNQRKPLATAETLNAAKWYVISMYGSAIDDSEWNVDEIDNKHTFQFNDVKYVIEGLVHVR